LHPARPAGSARLRGHGEPAAQPWELVLEGGDGGVVQVAADQAQVQVPALRAAVGSLDPHRDDVRVAGQDDARGLQPVQAGPHCPLRKARVADQRRDRRERACAVRPRVVGQADEHELARTGRLAAAVGRDRGQVERPGDRLDAHRAALLKGAARSWAAQPLVSVSVSFTSVRCRSPATARVMFGQVPDGGGCR